MKGENERLLHEILNDKYPGEWKQDSAFLTGRKYRGDAINEKRKIDIEIEGGIWMYGRHNHPEGMIDDMKKYNLAIVKGWKVLRYTPDTLRKSPNDILDDIDTLINGDRLQTKLPDGTKQKKL